MLFFMPLPFNQRLWNSHTLRHRMTNSVRRIVYDLTRDEVKELLGSYQAASPATFAFLIRRDAGISASGHDWFLISFDSVEDDGIVWRTLTRHGTDPGL